MKHSRRAAPTGVSSGARVGVRAAIAALATGLAAVAAVWGVVSLSVARRVVTPERRKYETRIVGVDLAAQTITLQRTPDTELPGRYGLFTSGSESYVKLGTVLSADASSVKRKLLTQIGPDSTLSAEAAFSGWYYDDPGQLHLPYSSELIGSSIGPCPAWLFPAEEPAAPTWVIAVHGRGTTRAETLRAVPLLHRLGLPVLAVSYRNDGDAPRSAEGTYALGATEWRDVDAAVGFALRNGAERVVLFGWSMGGAIVLQLSLSSPHRAAIAGIILDSPVIDWRVVLDYQAELMRLPGAVAGLAIDALQSPWAKPVTRADRISLDALNMVRRADELSHPILILHSDDDGFVPSDASHALAEKRPDIVELEVFQVARHTKLWNYDPERWSSAISRWLGERGLVPSAVQD